MKKSLLVILMFFILTAGYSQGLNGFRIGYGFNYFLLPYMQSQSLANEFNTTHPIGSTIYKPVSFVHGGTINYYFLSDPLTIEFQLTNRMGISSGTYANSTLDTVFKLMHKYFAIYASGGVSGELAENVRLGGSFDLGYTMLFDRFGDEKTIKDVSWEKVPKRNGPAFGFTIYGDYFNRFSSKAGLTFRPNLQLIFPLSIPKGMGYYPVASAGITVFLTFCKE